MTDKEKQNAKQFPTVFYAKHMETGLAAYENETILIDTDNIKSMIPTFVGKPVYIGHRAVSLDTLKEDAAGWITESFYNKLDGWLWVKFLAIDDACYQAIANGWSVSNAYIPTEWGGGGTHHNCPYDRRIVSGEFTHLAIVPDPRYEEAKIFTPDEFRTYQAIKEARLAELHNSKEGKTMFKFFKNERKEVSSVDEDTFVELQNGKTVSVKEMINAVADEKKEEEKEKANDMDMAVQVGEETMPLSELINRYSGLMNKQNAAEDDKKEEEKEKENADDKKEEDEKKNAEAEEKGEGEEKANSKDHFEELKNAHEKATQAKVVVETSASKLARGKERY